MRRTTTRSTDVEKGNRMCTSGGLQTAFSQMRVRHAADAPQTNFLRAARRSPPNRFPASETQFCVYDSLPTYSLDFTLGLPMNQDINVCTAGHLQKRITEMGEHITHCVPNKRRTKLAAKWKHGVSLGRSWNSDSKFNALSSGENPNCESDG